MRTTPECNDDPARLIEDMPTYYSHRAPGYDASMGYDRPDVVRSLEPIVTALCEAMRDRTVLEIACGPGLWTQFASRSAHDIVATDYNESTLAIARQQVHDAERVRFVRADAYDLTARSGTPSCSAIRHQDPTR